MTTGTRPEDQILICVARRSLDTAAAERIHSLVQRELDWDYLLNSANRHGLTQLLYRHLSSRCPEAVPEEVAAKLKEQFLGNSRAALHLTSELLRITKALEANGIYAVGFKGPLLSLAAYGEIGLRQFGDLDILIKERDFRRAQALLESEGYAIDRQLTAAQQSSCLLSDCELPFIHADTGCVVDLHWGLLPKRFPCALTQEDVFERLRTIMVGNNVLRIFSNEDLLLFLCVHGAKHLWSRLEWICSVAELISNSQELNWAALVERARESYSLNRLVLGLMVAKDIQPGLEIPGSVLEAVSDTESLRKCAKGIREKLFEVQPDKEDEIGIFLFHLTAMDRKRDAVVGLLRSMLLPTVADWRLVTLPDALYPMYYVLRPIRLVAEYAAVLSRRVGSRKRPMLKPLS